LYCRHFHVTILEIFGKFDDMMNSILNDLSDDTAVIKSIETNMFSFWTAYGHVPGGEVFKDARLIRFSTPFPKLLVNGVFGAQLTITQIDPTITEQIDYFKARGLSFYWWTGPATRPSDLEHRLLAHGLVDQGSVPGMAMDLAQLPDKVSMPDGFEIVTVTDEATLHQWVDAVLQGNGIPEAAHDTFYQLEQGIGLESRSGLYFGLLNGQPVACSTLHLESGVAGIYGVATAPEVRGRGIGTAMTLKSYLDARDKGYRVGVLQSSAMGNSVYRRMGFKKFCDLGVYLYRNQS
jgi:ribosomal protein S18 acetylase RimI-like enzyme